MAYCRQMFGGVILLALLSGCALEEVRSKNKYGVDFRYAGSRRGEDARYHVEPGLELKWEKGVTTGFSYRRRDVDDGVGAHDDGVFFDFGFPIWKRPKPEAKTAERIEQLERRLAELEARQAERSAEVDDDSVEEIIGGSEQRVAQVTGGTVPSGQNGKQGD